MTDYRINFEPLRQAFKDTPFDIDELPILDLGQKNGATGYIDFIQASDLSHSVMRGIDMNNRPFVSIKFHVRPNPNSSDINVQNTKHYEAVGTFFQRYADNAELWAYGTLYYGNTSLHYESRVRDYQYSNLASRLNVFLNGQIIRNIKYMEDDPDFVIGTGEFDISIE